MSFLKFPHGRRLASIQHIDATSHVYLLMETEARWARILGEGQGRFTDASAQLVELIQSRLWADDGEFFFDSWAADDPSIRRISFEGFWPVVVGAATPEQANRIIDRYMLSPDHFFGPHPLTTVSRSDPADDIEEVIYEIELKRGITYEGMVQRLSKAVSPQAINVLVGEGNVNV